MPPLAENTAGDYARVLVVDDHPAFRYGLRRLLESEPGFIVAGEAADGLEAVRLARELSPNVVTLDLALPQRSGLQVLGDLAALGSPPHTIILTATLEKADVARALQLGARGIVLKEATTQMIIEGIRTVLKGQYWVDRETASDLVQMVKALLPQEPAKAGQPNFGLSPRELQVVAAITAGYSNEEIGLKLSISTHTVKHHITNIFDKLGLSNRMELVLFAISHQLADNA